MAIIHTLRQDRDARILTFLKETDAEICRQLEIEEDIEDYAESLVYAYNYLDIMERIAFLLKLRKIPKYLADYYQDFFNYAVTMMGWYTSVCDDPRPRESWPSLIKWFAQNKTNQYIPDHLAPIMRDILIQKISPACFLEKVAKIVNEARVELGLKPGEPGGVNIKSRKQEASSSIKST